MIPEEKFEVRRKTKKRRRKGIAKPIDPIQS